MADATPVNRTLLFKSPQEFKAVGQFDYANADPAMFASKRISSNALPHMGRHMMVRNMDEIRRMPAVMEAMSRSQFHVGSPTTVDTNSASFPDSLPSPESGTDTATHYLPPLEDHDDWVETQRWDEGAASYLTGQQSTQSAWSWPMEVLYQKYHVVIALDMSKSTFEVSRNGSPFVDRIPQAIESILNTIALTLEARRVEVCATKAWMKAYLPQDTCQSLLEMLWDPKMIVSIVFVNAPHRTSALIHQGGAPKHSSDHHTSNVEDEDDAAVTSPRPLPNQPEVRVPVTTTKAAPEVPLTQQALKKLSMVPSQSSTNIAVNINMSSSPPEQLEPKALGGDTSEPSSPRRHSGQVPFLDLSLFPFGVLDDSSDYSVERTFPLVVQCPAEDIMQDETFIPRISTLIMDFENLYRKEMSESGEQDHWPEVNIDETIERSLRFVPFDNEYCHSVSIVSNFAVCGCSETIALQESQVIRKNVILACLSLNRFVPWESPHLTPLGHFLIACGGFGLHVDQWMELSAEEVTMDWCQRFEGARCLAQQMFVQLVSKFPVVSPGVSTRLDTLIPTIRAQPYLVEAQLEVFRVEGSSSKSSLDVPITPLSTMQVLRMLSTARQNEGWSVVMDVHPQVSAAHLYARLDHFLHKGSLTVFYEATVNSPMLFRKMKIQGTPALVRQLCTVQLDDKLTVSSTAAQSSRHWHTYIALLRGLLDGWMRADDELLALYQPPRLIQTPALKQSHPLAPAISQMSRLQGCTAEWLSRFCVESTVCVFSYASPCARMIDNLFGGVSLDNAPKSKGSLQKRPNDPLLVELSSAMVQALTPLGFLVVQEASVCNTPSTYNSKHCILARTTIVGDTNSEGGERRALDVVQAFVIDESGSGMDLVAATCEIRHSFSHRSPMEKIAVMEEVRAAVATVCAARSSSHIHFETIPLKSSCVARRAMCMVKHDLLSKWSDASSASSATQAPSRASMSRSSQPKRLVRHSRPASSLAPTSSQARHTVQYAAQRVFVLGAHGSELFLMKGTTSMRWSFGAFVRRPTPLLATTALMLLGLRREHDGFKALHAHASGKRLLLRRNVELPIGRNRRNEKVDVHDVLEVELSEGRWDLRVVRHISHYDRILGLLGQQACTALTQDIQQDYETLSTLLSLQESLTHPFHDKDTVATSLWTTPAAQKDIAMLMRSSGGQLDVQPTLESIVPHLRADAFIMVELQPPPSTGSIGSWELERGVYHVAANLGDEVITLPSLSKLHVSLVDLLCGHRSIDDASHMVQVTRLSPRIGVPLLTLLISVCPNHRPSQHHPTSSASTSTRVLIGTVDTSSVLYHLFNNPTHNVAPSQLDVMDVNFMRIRLQPTPLMTDALLLHSTEALLRAYATAMHPRSIHRECLWRCARQAPGTPTMAHSSTVASETSNFPSISLMSAGSPSDPPSMYLGNQTLSATQPLIACSELKAFYSSMMAYSTSVDVTFLAKLQYAGLLTEAAIVELVGQAVHRRQASLKCMSSICTDLADGPLYNFDARHARLEETPQATMDKDAAAASWDGGSERSSPGVLKDMGVIEAEQVGCLVRLLLHKQFDDPSTPDELQWIGAKRSMSTIASPTNASATQRAAPSKMTLTFVAITLPDALFDMSRNRFRPSGHMLRAAAKAALENGGVVPIEVPMATKASADFVGRTAPSSSENSIDVFFAPEISSVAAKAVSNTSIPLSRLPEALSSPLEFVADSIATFLGDSAIELGLDRSSPFLAARRIMSSTSLPPPTPEGSIPPDTGTWNTTASSADALECSMASKQQTLVRFEEQDLLRRVLAVSDITSFCQNVVFPAFMCTKTKHKREEFSVEFTRTVRHGDAVDPFAATQQVFSQVLLEEGLCMIPTSNASYLLIPSLPLFSKGVVMLVQLERRHNIHVDTISISCFESPDETTSTKGGHAGACSAAVRDACAEMRKLISQKVAQVSQIHLLRELRERERASDELLPQQWGDQFVTPAPDAAQQEAKLRKAIFLCPGHTVAEIPIYYRLQHQPKSILTKIVGNSHKMHLYRIYDREQCFVVMDDTAEDAFHIVRLVFTKVGAQPQNAMMFPMCLIDRVDVCNAIAVQVYSAHPNPKISHVIEALQDFCYLLAVQELETRLKISFEKDLHAHDWAFLRYDKREPLTLPMMAGGQLWHPAIRDLAKWFLLRNMNECKFRFFATREALMNINLPNSFLSHYQLHRGGESTVDMASSADTGLQSSIDSVASPACDDTGGAEGELRFVKREEGSTDVLLSCGVHFQTDQHKIVVDVYTTKLPNFGNAALAERVATMTKALRQCLSDTALHVNFFLASQRTTPGSSYTPKLRPLSIRHAISLADNLIGMSHEIRVQELSILKRRTYDLRHVNVVHLGPLLERLVGLLQEFNPHLITSEDPRTNVVIRGFPWSWMEERQNQHNVDHYFILCGFQLIEEGGAAPQSQAALSPQSPQGPPSDNGALVKIRPTRAHAAAHPSFPLDTTTSVEMIRGSLQQAGEPSPSSNLAALYDKPKIILHVNLREGVEVVAFNLKDSETLLNLVGVVIHDTARKSSIHRDVLMQSLGFDVPTAFNEQELARMCCGDQRNVQEPQTLNIMSEVLHRSAVMVRFPKQAILSPKVSSNGTIDLQDAFSMVVAGLSNRGTMVNHVFPYDGAVKVLFDDGLLWTMQQCKEAVDQLIALGVFIRDPSPLFGLQADTASHTYAYAKNQTLRNFRIAMPHALNVPHTALVANAYHRQLQRAHILIEAKNARSKVSDGIAKFERCWAARATCARATLVRHIIQLQLKSKQVKGLRVPDFTFRSEALSPKDLVLDPKVPTMTTDRQKVYCCRVDDMLRQYVNYLRGVFGDAVHVVEVDPSLKEFSDDPDIAARLRCRYGKVADRESSTGYLTFNPRLFFVVMTVADAMAAVRAHRHNTSTTTDARGESLTASFFSPNSAAPPPNSTSSSSENTSSGYFVVEIGFQVVNYALDYYIIGGSGNALHSDVNLAATLLKQRFLFSSVVYDLGVHRLVQQVLHPAQTLGGEQPIAMAAKNLVKYYPSPPGYSSNYVHSFSVTEPMLLNLKQLLVHPSQMNASEPSSQVIVAPAHILRRQSTQDVYSVVGVLSWEVKPKLYVILATERSTVSHRVARRDMAPLLAQAKQLLVDQLMDATAPLRAYDAWRNLCKSEMHSPRQGMEGGVGEIRSDEFHLIKKHSTPHDVTQQWLRQCCSADGTTPLLDWPSILKQANASANVLQRSGGVHLRVYEEDDTRRGCLFVTPAIEDSSPHSSNHEGEEDVLLAAVLCTTQLSDGTTRLQLQLWKPLDPPSHDESAAEEVEVEDLLREAVSRVLVSATWNESFSTNSA